MKFVLLVAKRKSVKLYKQLGRSFGHNFDWSWAGRIQKYKFFNGLGWKKQNLQLCNQVQHECAAQVLTWLHQLKLLFLPPQTIEELTYPTFENNRIDFCKVKWFLQEFKAIENLTKVGENFSSSLTSRKVSSNEHTCLFWHLLLSATKRKIRWSLVACLTCQMEQDYLIESKPFSCAPYWESCISQRR